MPNGGTILVRGENLPGLSDGEIAGDYVRLSVVDTGVGMPPEILSRVFEPFFTTKDVGKGSGLGLAQVHGFATQSRGTVRIKSQVDQGTSIELYLPRSLNLASKQRHLIDFNRAVRPKQSGQGQILLVEDDDEVATLVGEMLGQLGYEVTRAASAAAALGALADGRSVDLIFSDIMMPGGMNGVEPRTGDQAAAQQHPGAADQRVCRGRDPRSRHGGHPDTGQTLPHRRGSPRR